MWMVIQGNLALAALLTGDTDAASQAFREELRLCRELVVRPAACEGLLGLAAIAALGGDIRRAARLVGAASAHIYGLHQDIIEARLDAAFLQPCGKTPRGRRMGRRRGPRCHAELRGRDRLRPRRTPAGTANVAERR